MRGGFELEIISTPMFAASGPSVERYTYLPTTHPKKMSDALQIHLPSDALSEVQVQPSSPRDSAVAGPFDCVKKLTHDQVKSGWREGFSSTMARPYFYNIFTRESVWSIPDAMSKQRESGSAPDILQTAIAELTADGVAQARRNNQKASTSTPVDYTAPQ